MEKVTPQLEFGPDRQYRRTGAIITCHKVISCSCLYALEVNEEVMFTINMPSVEDAKTLMNDIYYGEYTGA